VTPNVLPGLRLIGEVSLHSWQVILIFFGALGLLVAPLTMMIPSRHGSTATDTRRRGTFRWPPWCSTTKHMPER